MGRAIGMLDGAELDGHSVVVKRMGEERMPSQPDGRTIFVGGLSWDVGSEDLKIFASQLGEVTFATVCVDKVTGRSRGFGKVQFASVEMAEQASNDLNGR